MILVVGATGELGRAAVQQLLAEGMPVRAMTRTPEKAEDLRLLGAEVVQGDLIDPPSLAKACRGVESVVAAAHQLMGSGKYASKAVDDLGHRALIDAAKAAGVRHFVYVSVIGVSPDNPVAFVRTKFAIEQVIKASGMDYTILRCSAFMEWHAHNLLGKDLLEKGKATIFGKGENPTNFVSARDVAKFVLIALKDPRACNQTIEVGGAENFTKNQVAEMYTRLAGKPAKVNHVPPIMLRIMPVIMRVVKPDMVDLIKFARYSDTSDQTFDPSATLRQYPMQLTRLEDFVRQKVTESTR